MGMDIYAESGVIATISDMVRIIRKKDLRKVINAIEDLTQDENFDTEVSVSKNSTLEEVREALIDCENIKGEPSKYGGDCHIENGYELLELWNRIIEVARPELPSLMDVRIFDSGRVNGWDVPHGESCYIFDQDECFETKLSDTGKSLKRAIGHCVQTEWTVMSV